MIISKQAYKTLESGGSHVVHWQSLKRRVEILEPMTVTQPNGETEEIEGTFERYNITATDPDGAVRSVGCPAPVGTVRQFNYRDKKTGKRSEKLYAIVVDCEPYVGAGRRPMWKITWERAGTKHRPLPDDSGVYLAHDHGYTSSPGRALDADAPVMVDDSVKAMIAEDQAFAKEQRKRRLIEQKKVAEAVSKRIAEELADLDGAA